MDSHSRSRPALPRITAVAAALALALALAPTARAAILEVNSADDSASDGSCDPLGGAGEDCTFRDAVDASEGSGEADVINDPGFTHETGDGGEIVFTGGDGAVTVNGAGADNTVLDASTDGTDHRVIAVILGADVTLNGVTLRDGAETGEGGGGALNLAVLTLNASKVVDNQAETGGGIHNDHGATLTVNGSELSENHAEDAGGGIFNAFGALLVVSESTVADNIADGSGGGIHNESGGGPLPVGPELESETGMTVERSTVSLNGGQFEGGGVWNGPDATGLISETTIDRNFTDDFELGGGIFNSGTLELVKSAVTTNGFFLDERGRGRTGFGSSPQGDGLNEIAGLGGGIYNGPTERAVTRSGPFFAPIRLNAENSTLSGNLALEGGGLFNDAIGIRLDRATEDPGDPTEATLKNVTVAANTALGIKAPGEGGGIYNTGGLGSMRAGELGGNGMVSLKNTIVALNTGEAGASNCGGVEPTSQGHNLEDVDTCGLGDSPGDGDITGQDPILGVLAGNGGPTMTHALLEGSPAIDNADAGDCPPDDQRSVARPQRTGCDIGAYEAEGPPPEPAAPQSPQQQLQAPAPVAAPPRPGRPRVRVAGIRSRCVSRSMRVSVRASGDARVRFVRVYVDGRRIRTVRRSRFAIRISARRLRAGRHRVTFIATDTAGSRRRSTRRFTVCGRRAQRRAAPRFTG